MKILFLFILLISDSTESDKIVNYRGKKIVFVGDSSLVRIYGDASADYGKLHIWADTLVYNIEKKFLMGKGNVKFNNGGNDLYADRMTYDVELKKGKAFNGMTEVENGWFYGDEIRYYEGDVLKIRNGYYTTCENEKPHYRFYSPNMRVNIDRDLVAEPVILLVNRIPLFYLPFWFHPLKKERSSGILTPNFGSSSYGGRYIENIGWYQTLGPHADVSVYMDYYTGRGIKNHIEGRWELFPFGDGNIDGSYIEERDPIRKRWSLKLNNRSRLPGNINLNVHSDITSDSDFYSDYETGEVDRLLRDISYGGNVSTEVLGFGVYGIVDYREEVVSGNIDKKWPVLNVRAPGLELGPLNLRNQIKYSRDETKHWASGVNSYINMGFRIMYFDLNLNLSAMGDYYEREDYLFKYWNSSFSIKTRMYGLSLFPVGPVSKVRHVMTPTVTLGYAPEPDSISIMSLPGFTTPGGRKSIGISLNNLFQCKVGDNKYDFASLNLHTNYRPSTDRLSDVSFNGNLWVGDNFRQTYSTSYNLYSQEFGDRKITTDLAYRLSLAGEPLGINLGHRVNFTDEERIQQADLEIDFNITPNWSVNVGTHYDFEENRVTRSSIKLNRDLHCWKMSFSFNSFGDRWDYNFNIQIKKLQEIKLERGTLRTLLP